jgi:hypothetical protein
MCAHAHVCSCTCVCVFVHAKHPRCVRACEWCVRASMCHAHAVAVVSVSSRKRRGLPSRVAHPAPDAPVVREECVQNPCTQPVRTMIVRWWAPTRDHSRILWLSARRRTPILRRLRRIGLLALCGIQSSAGAELLRRSGDVRRQHRPTGTAVACTVVAVYRSIGGQLRTQGPVGPTELRPLPNPWALEDQARSTAPDCRHID